jgi:hypothetical protein
MAGKTKKKPPVGKTAKKPGGTKKKTAASKYEAELAALAKRLEKATAAAELSKIALAYHSVSYSLGHDIPAIMANIELPTIATHGKLIANERCAEAYARDGNIKHAIHHLFEALEMAQSRTDLARLGERAATLLEPRDRKAAKRIRDCVSKLPAGDKKASEAYWEQHEKLKSFDWDLLPSGG